jgi:hypothetical protein
LLLLLLLLLLLQTVSESNREQLQPLIDLALQCAYNSSIQGEARCRPTTMSIAIPCADSTCCLLLLLLLL